MLFRSFDALGVEDVVDVLRFFASSLATIGPPASEHATPCRTQLEQGRSSLHCECDQDVFSFAEISHPKCALSHVDAYTARNLFLTSCDRLGVLCIPSPMFSHSLSYLRGDQGSDDGRHCEAYITDLLSIGRGLV